MDKKCTKCGSLGSTITAPHINNGKTICLECLIKLTEDSKEVKKE